MICIALPEILLRGSFTSATANRKNISTDIGENPVLRRFIAATPPRFWMGNSMFEVSG